MKILNKENINDKTYTVVEKTNREKTRSKRIDVIESPKGLEFKSIKNKNVKVLFSTYYYYLSKVQKQKEIAFMEVNMELKKNGLSIRI